ncbi:MAG: hypothetical protein H7254_05260 [Ferruginibacter sp.]|nr:hypothetical protein [Ferruginibacter sp.]
MVITNEGDNNYLMNPGITDLVSDKVRMKYLWSLLMKVWFPTGL